MVDTIIKDIDKIVGKVNVHPEYSGCVRGETSISLREEAEKHSLDIELLSEGKKLTRKQRATFLRQLDDAREFLFSEGVNNYSLSKLGSMVEPAGNSTGGFRKTQVNFGGFWPTEAERIPYEIQNLVDFLENAEVHPILRASNSHLELVRIHPFEDGNGRSARLLQNLCLQERGYPVAIIPADERKEYLEVMKNVLRDRYSQKSFFDDPSESEKEFHKYIASKVLNSALRLDNVLKSRRMYDVELGKVRGKGVAGTVASTLRGIGRCPNHNGVCVKIKNGNGSKKSVSLGIRGDVSQDEIERVLNVQSEKFGITYKINGRYC